MLQTLTSFLVCLCTIKNFIHRVFSVSLEIESFASLPEVMRLMLDWQHELAQFPCLAFHFINNLAPLSECLGNKHSDDSQESTGSLCVCKQHSARGSALPRSASSMDPRCCVTVLMGDSYCCCQDPFGFQSKHSATSGVFALAEILAKKRRKRLLFMLLWQPGFVDSPFI